MHYIPISTRTMRPPQDDLFTVFKESLPIIKNGDLIVVTSKIVAIHQGDCVLMESTDKQSLVLDQAEAWIDVQTSYTSSPLCIKYGALFYGAGVDASNSGEYYTTLPTNPYGAAAYIHDWVCKEYAVEKLGVIITDSHSLPLRRGVLSISIGCHGFVPINDYTGKMDLFGRKLQFTATNIADSVAAGASAVSGEAAEATPIVIARDVPNVVFTDGDVGDDILISAKEDIYYPLLKQFYE